MDKQLEFEECLKTWHGNGFSVRLYSLGHKTWRLSERPQVGYRFRDHGKLIFEGADFGPSPMYSIDGIEAVYSLLGFLSLRPGDTDEEYKYTPEQLEWCNSMRCDELQLMVSDFEERQSKRNRRR